ncbi:sensor histidine kinase [Winogradskyella ursingii]|uniref:sensor histidine kinase n=1 Tax=Winogradskyella ursingii TaxID=2686079 RepID=UPI0015CB139E|nr:sensor histidine kinase [Winogradskyella ursingii]
MKNTLTLLIIISVELFCFGQNDSTYYYFDRTSPVENILERIKSAQNPVLKDYYKLVYHSKKRHTDSMLWYINSIEAKKNLPEYLAAKFLYFKAYQKRITQNDDLSFQYHIEALNKARKLNDESTVLYALSALAQSYNYEDDRPYRLDYLDELERTTQLYNNSKFKIISPYLRGNFYLHRENDTMAIKHFKNVLNQNFTKLDSSFYLKTLSSVGVMFTEDLKQPDSGLVYYKKMLDILDQNKTLQNTNNYFNCYLNISTAYNYKNDLGLALYYTLKADSIPIAENVASRKSIVRQNLADIYAKRGNFKNAYLNSIKYTELTDSINRRELAKGIAKYENKELKSQNKATEASRKKIQNIALGLGGSLAVGSIFALLIYKNTKRKQKLAEQEKVLESQKLANALKEQELTAIDAMIEGQEKERQRIANDLHDDLGGLMATVKLHFNALKDHNSPDLFDKTNRLIEEAYQKVRTVAHAKNSGVIAKQGLLRAVQQMADKVSTSNKIQIEVIDHGLDNRLENSLELTLFRITQELITNIIKHANATEATIHLTNHEHSINIMVEDNGKGFDASQITKKNKGMGISSIDKRVEHLEGTMTIESEKNKGTTIIIDVPL